MKRPVSILLIFCMMLMLSGCGNTDSSGGKQRAPGSGTPATPTLTQAGEPSPSPEATPSPTPTPTPTVAPTPTPAPISDLFSTAHLEEYRAIRAYGEYMKKQVLAGKYQIPDEEHVYFTLKYLDEDTIPELLFTTSSAHMDVVTILTYHDGKVVDLGVFGSSGVCSYNEEEHLIGSQYSGFGAYELSVFELKDAKAVPVITLMKSEMSGEYMINDVPVSEEQFTKAIETWEQKLTLQEFGDYRTSNWYIDTEMAEQPVNVESFIEYMYIYWADQLLHEPVFDNRIPADIWDQLVGKWVCAGGYATLGENEYGPQPDWYYEFTKDGRILRKTHSESASAEITNFYFDARIGLFGSAEGWHANAGFAICFPEGECIGITRITYLNGYLFTEEDYSTSDYVQIISNRYKKAE
ncbi:MAG: hypothetical protein MJ064_04550 [Lachnospiraceae bacterium]|nr:hypothetical protein [Lachnospiraceae bacterium]